jgi:hypothetical protein
MPHASVKLKPGIDQNETPALNEAGISFSNLIRFIYDREGLGLIQKLGGWTKFYPNTIESIIRALWAWEDTNSNSHLAVGTQNNTNTNVANLSVITNGLRDNITPQTLTDDLALQFATTAGSPVVTVTDTTNTDISDFDSVYIQVQVAIGGLILFGNYRTFAISSTTYNIIATDLLGAPQAAATSSTTEVLPEIDVTSGSAIVTITLPNHGYLVGDTFPILASTVVGGATFFGNYIVQDVLNANEFTIISTVLPTSSTTGFVNGNDVRVTYNFGAAPGAVGYGYGGNGYGLGGYGNGVSPASLAGSEITAFDWTLDNWGEVLIACPRNDTLYQPIYEWNPTSGIPIASVIPEAPMVNDGVFVAMPQRQIIAWGSTFSGVQDPLLIRWCDVNNYNSWIGTVTNQAGSYRIPKGSKIVGCLQGPQQALVWTDLGVWAMQYVGPPFVYSFNEIGTGCGLIAKKAAASISGSVYWMGPSQFFKLSGEGVAPVACPIWDVIFQDLDQTQLDKIRVAVNSRFGEITWYYPTESNGGEVNAYAKYNVYLQQWDYGTLARSAWIDQSVLGPPIGADPDSLYIYQHETSTDADGQPLLASFQTGYFTMSNADVKMFVDQVWPDMKWGYFGGTQNATVNLTFFTTDYPGQTPQQFGPYPLTQSTTFISPRFRGRLVSIKLDSTDVGSFWRIGNIRYRTKEDGKF